MIDLGVFVQRLLNKKKKKKKYRKEDFVHDWLWRLRSVFVPSFFFGHGISIEESRQTFNQLEYQGTLSSKYLVGFSGVMTLCLN